MDHLSGQISLYLLNPRQFFILFSAVVSAAMSEDNVDLSGGPENHPRTLPRGRCYSMDWLGVGREGFDKCQIPFFSSSYLVLSPLSARPIIVTFGTRIEIDPCLQPDLDKSFAYIYTTLAGDGCVNGSCPSVAFVSCTSWVRSGTLNCNGLVVDTWWPLRQATWC